MTDAVQQFDNVAFMKDMYKAFAEGLYGTFAGGGNEETFKYFDPDFTWVTAHNGWHFKGSPYVGIGAVWDYVFTNAGTDFKPETYAVEVEEMIDLGADHVLVRCKYCGHSVETDKFHKIKVAHLWTLKNGRMRKFEQFTDTYKMQHLHQL